MRLVRRAVQVQDGEGAAQAGGVQSLLLVGHRRVVDDLLARVQRAGQLALQLVAVALQHADVQRPEVVEEVLVQEVVVDGEVVRVDGVPRPRRLRLEGDEVQAICDRRRIGNRISGYGLMDGTKCNTKHL